MHTTKAAFFGSRHRPKSPKSPKPQKQSALNSVIANQMCEGSEPRMFSFDEELEAEEVWRESTAPVHHLCAHPA